MVKVKSIKNVKQYLWGSLLALLFPCTFILLWGYVVQTTTGGQDLRREHFYFYFPSFLQQGLYLEGIVILCCIAAFVFGFKALPTSNKGLQAIALFMMALATICTAFFLFSLM